jgi:hypothetical protein
MRWRLGNASLLNATYGKIDAELNCIAILERLARPASGVRRASGAATMTILIR